MKEMKYAPTNYEKILDPKTIRICIPEIPNIKNLSLSVRKTIKYRMKKAISQCNSLDELKKLAEYISFGKSKVTINVMSEDENTPFIAVMLKKNLTKPISDFDSLIVYKLHIIRQNPTMLGGEVYSTNEGRIKMNSHFIRYEIIGKDFTYTIGDLTEIFTSIYVDNISYNYAISYPDVFGNIRAYILYEAMLELLKSDLESKYHDHTKNEMPINESVNESNKIPIYIPENIDVTNMIVFLRQNYNIPTDENIKYIKTSKLNKFGRNSLLNGEENFNYMQQKTALAIILFTNKRPIKRKVKQKKIYEINCNLTKKTLRLMNESTLLNTFRFVELSNEVNASVVSTYEKAIEEIATIIPLDLCKKYSLHIKKLGKHHARGLLCYAESIKSIIIDVRSTDAFIHELGHAIDKEYMDLNEKIEFSSILESYQNYLNSSLPLKQLSTKRLDYYLLPKECFARSFEIYAYQKGLRTTFNNIALNKYLYPMEDKIFVENICTYFDNLITQTLKTL